MDGPERNGMRDAGNSPESDALADDPSNMREPAPAQAPPVSSEPFDMANPLEDPNLEAVRKKMLASNTQRTQQLSHAQAENQRLQESLNADRNALAAHMNQINSQQQAAQPANVPKGSFDHLPSNFRTQENAADLRELMDAIDSTSAGKLDSVNADNAQMKEQVAALTARIDQADMNTRHKVLERQATEISTKYGDAITPDIGQRMGQALQQNPNMDMNLALLHVAPQVVQNHMQATANAAAQETIDGQLATMGGVSGMNDELLGTAPSETFQDGETFMETARRELGTAGFAKLLAEGRQPTDE